MKFNEALEHVAQEIDMTADELHGEIKDRFTSEATEYNMEWISGIWVDISKLMYGAPASTKSNIKEFVVTDGDENFTLLIET